MTPVVSKGDTVIVRALTDTTVATVEKFRADWDEKVPGIRLVVIGGVEPVAVVKQPASVPPPPGTVWIDCADDPAHVLMAWTDDQGSACLTATNGHTDATIVLDEAGELMLARWLANRAGGWDALVQAVTA